MRPYHLLQFVALLIGVVLLRRPAPAPEAAPWTQSVGGWLTALLILGFALASIAAGAVGLLVAIRMRSFAEFGLGLATVGVAILVLVRALILPLR
jgi:hypothetical protein